MRSLIFVLFICVLFLVSYGQRSSSLPPEPVTLSGSTSQKEHFIYFVWKEGMRLLVVDDFQGLINRNSTWTMSDGLPYLYKEKVKSDETEEFNKIDFVWSLKINEGETGIIESNGNEYDLAKGTFFYLRQINNEVIVEQHLVDFSKLKFNKREIQKFISEYNNKNELVY